MQKVATTLADALCAQSRARRIATLSRETSAQLAVMRAVAALLPPGGRAWLIGSLAWGGFGPQSDVDLVVDGVAGDAVTALEGAACTAAQAPVDILRLSELPASFRDRVLREGLAIHGA